MEIPEEDWVEPRLEDGRLRFPPLGDRLNIIPCEGGGVSGVVSGVVSGCFRAGFQGREQAAWMYEARVVF